MVIQLVAGGAGEWGELSRFLDDQADLLCSEAADAMLAVIYRSYVHRPFQERIEAIRLILDEARHKGFDGREQPLSSYFKPLFDQGGPLAELDLPEPPEDEERDQFSAVLFAFLASPSWEERRRLATTYRTLLLTDEAQHALQAIGNNAGGDSPVFTRLVAVLADAQSRGPEAAFAGYLPPAFVGGPGPAERAIFTEDELLQLVVLEYARTPTWERRKELVTSEPEVLLSDGAGDLLDALVQRYAVEPVKASGLKVASDVLAVARSAGIDAAFRPDLPPTGVRFNQVITGHDADGIDRLTMITTAREAMFQVDRALAPWTWAALNVGLADLLVAVDLREAALRPVYGEEALLRCSRALEVFTEASAPDDWLRTQALLGRIFLHRQRGDRAVNGEAAIAYLTEARQRFNERGDVDATLKTTVDLAQAYETQVEGVRGENLAVAYALCAQAVANIPRSENPGWWAETKVLLGQICMERASDVDEANRQEAIAHLREAVVVPELQEGPSYGIAEYLLGMALALSGREGASWHDHLSRALQLYPRDESPYHWASIQHSLGVGFFRLQPDDSTARARAGEHYRAALEVFEGGTYPGERRRTLRALGAVLFRERRWSETYDVLSEAISLSDYLESSAFTLTGLLAEVAETADIFDRAAYCLLQLKRPAEAMSMVDVGKTRSLRRAMAPGDDVPPELRQEVEGALAELRSQARGELPLVGDRTTALANARARLEAARAAADAAAAHAGDEGLSPDAMRSLAPEAGALVIPLVTSQGSALFVLTRDPAHPYGEVVALEGLTDNDLRALFDGTEGRPGWLGVYHRWVATYEALDDADLFDDDVVAVAESEYARAERAWAGTIARAGAELWRKLMGPLHECLIGLGLPEGATVVMVPSKWLPLLPLHAAWTKTSSGRRFFVDDFALAYAPSAFLYNRSLASIRRQTGRTPSVLAVIDATEDLRFAATEGERVVAPFRGAATTLPGREAVRDRLIAELPGRSHLHMACHGSFDWHDPPSSSLLLAGGDPLTLREISSLVALEDLRLVTLSACETGIIESDRVPNEYLGLPSVFLQIGAPGVVSTLWNVDDEATALLMEKFYEEHIGQGKTPAVALRRAQLYVRSIPQFEHPFYWAAFESVGA